MKENLNTIARDRDGLPRFIRYLDGHPEQDIQAELSNILVDRDLESLGRMIAMTRELNPEQLKQFGTTNDRITQKLDVIAERVGDRMPKRWRPQQHAHTR